MVAGDGAVDQCEARARPAGEFAVNELRFMASTSVDQEPFVRFAQSSALFPMMQFSLAPWRVLDERHLAAVALRQKLVPQIMALVETARTEGLPILRPLAFRFGGHEGVQDQFLLGTWRNGEDDTVQTGPAELEIPVTLESLPWWREERV